MDCCVRGGPEPRRPGAAGGWVPGPAGYVPAGRRRGEVGSCDLELGLGGSGGEGLGPSHAVCCVSLRAPPAQGVLTGLSLRSARRGQRVSRGGRCSPEIVSLSSAAIPLFRGSRNGVRLVKQVRASFGSVRNSSFLQCRCPEATSARPPARRGETRSL